MAVTLVVETGSGITGANTYIDLADAEEYILTRLNVTVWDAATDDLKNRALVMATRIIDSRMDWKGRMVQPLTQALQWPREDIEIDDEEWSATEVPNDVKNATVEFALFLLTGDRTADDASSGLESIGVGDGAVDLKFNNRTEADLVPDTVIDLLGRWIDSAGSGTGQVRTRRV